MTDSGGAAGDPAVKLLELNLMEEGALPIIRTSTGAISPSRSFDGDSNEPKIAIPEALSIEDSKFVPVVDDVKAPSSLRASLSNLLEVPAYITQLYFAPRSMQDGFKKFPEEESKGKLTQKQEPPSPCRTSQWWKFNVKFENQEERPMRLDKYSTIRLNQFSESEVEYVPYASLVFIVIWVLTLIVQFSIKQFRIVSFRENPFWGLSELAKVELGALRLADSFGKNVFLRLLGSNFQHAGIVDLLFNSCAMYKFGARFEKNAGLLKTVLIPIASGTFASALASLISPHTSITGATGITFTICGMLLADLCTSWKLIQKNRRRNTLEYVFGFLVALYAGLLPAVSNW
jgi:membrane associated rhomboid family serine protease